MAEVFHFELKELPVSINDIWMPVRNRLVLTPNYRAWRKAVAWEIAKQCKVGIDGNYALHVELSAPDKRSRDLDNFSFKAISDAAQDAGRIVNDNKCMRLKSEWVPEGPAVKAYFISTGDV